MGPHADKAAAACEHAAAGRTHSHVAAAAWHYMADGVRDMMRWGGWLHGWWRAVWCW